MLVSPERDRLATATELGAELLELVRPAAEALGSAALLAFVATRVVNL